jgi:hypothetical protein
MRMSGPVLDAPDVPLLTRFYEKFLGWPVEELYEAGNPPGAGWGRVRSESGEKIEIQWEEHYMLPVWPGAAGQPGMQIHLDIWVEDLAAGIAWAVDCGATEASPQPADRDLTRLRIMLDPAGHPFCLWS